VSVEEHTITLAGAPVFYRSAMPGRGAVPTIYLHGAPTSSEDWAAPLERTGGLAPDLLGFGRTGKGGHLDYTPGSLADFVEDLLSALGIDRLHLVTHGWGTAAGVLLAAAHPERVQRLVLFNSVPLMEGLSWPWWARMYRARALGELAMGSATRLILARWLRRGAADPGAWPPERVARVWEQFDQGTQRAILRLVRSVDGERREAMSSALRSLQMPTLLIWGEQDPWWGSEVLNAYASRLPRAEIRRVAAAGHWPWLDDASVIDLMATFLEDAASV
jgi:pimeloyl-ACP methyl ester carboxylesterase